MLFPKSIVEESPEKREIKMGEIGKESSISKNLFVLALSYLIAGAALLSYFVIISLISIEQSAYAPVHLGLIGALNIFASYSIIKTRRWAPYAVTLISLISLVFGFIILSALIIFLSLDIVDILVLVGMGAYTLLSATLLIYVILNRSKFK
jgi:hypothetical protein